MKIKDGFFMTEVGTDYVVIAQTPAAKKIFDGMLRLNSTGAFLWDRLLEGASADELVSALVAEYGVDAVTAGNDSTAFLDNLRSVGLLDE